jgi:putative ABC transport system permease protein
VRSPTGFEKWCSVIWTWAAREIRRQIKFNLFFIFNLSIGLVGFLCLDTFKTSLDNSFQQNAKSYLSADLAISARKMFSEAERENFQKLVGENIPRSRIWELFSMVATNESSRLVQVKAIDEQFPFYGILKLGSGRVIQQGDAKELNQKKIVWVYPELLMQLKVQVGQTLTIGDEPYLIADTIVEDSSQGFRVTSIAAKVFVGMEQLKKSKLVSVGTTMSESNLFKLPPELDSAALVQKLQSQIEDPGIQIVNYISAAEDSGRALKYLSDYLGLVSLVALFLAGLGSAYLFRSFIYSRFYDIAILNSLGLTKKRAQRIYLAHLLLLGLGASVLSLIGATLSLPILSGALKALTPVAIPVAMSLKTTFLALMMGIAGSLLIGWPFLKPTERIQTSNLLTEGAEISATGKWQDLLLFLPGLFLYWVLSVWQAKSLKIGSQFVLLFLGSLVALWILGWLILKLIRLIKVQQPWTVRQALISLSRRQLSSLAVLVSLGLGTVLMNLLPQLKVSLKEDLAAPQNLKLPSLFLFDIQDEQLEPLKKFLAERKLSLAQVSPMIRARIIKVNDVPYERAAEEGQFRTREDESKARFRNRSVNLTYRDRLSDSETLKEGRDFSGRFDPQSKKPAELSVEYRFADQMNLNLNDRLTFEIQGVEVEGEIVNLRSVKWNSFQPNFFIQMQSGVLDEAPKTILASISASPEQVPELQNSLVKQFSNVSMIDVARVIEKVMQISEQMAWSLELMAGLSLLAGFVVLFSIANYEVRRRSWDLNLLKIFGASHRSLFKYLVFEFGLLGFLASFFGALISLAVTWILSRLLFEGTYRFDLTWPLLIILMVTGLSVVILWIVSHHVIRERPSELLQQK